MATSTQDDDSSRDDCVAGVDGDLSSVKRKPRSAAAGRRAPGRNEPGGRDRDADADKDADEALSEVEDGGSDDSIASKGSAHDREFSLTISAAMLRRAAVVAGALVLATLVGIGGWQWYTARQQVRDFGEVKAAASKFIITSIEYTSSDKVDKAKEAQGPLVTGKMREELSQDRAEAATAVRNQGIKATAKVDSAAVESLSRNEATTLMVVTATGTSNLSPTPQKRTVALRLELRREGGKWLVSESKAVGDFSATGVNPQPGTRGAPAPN